VGLTGSAGLGNWDYLYNQANEGGVKFISLLWNGNGTHLRLRTTVLRLRPSADSSMVSGIYKATLTDFGGNIIYKVTGTLTGTPLRVDIEDEHLH